MRYLFLILLVCPCTIDAAIITQQQKDDYDVWLWLVTLGAPCTTKIDVIEGACDLQVRRKQRVRK